MSRAFNYNTLFSASGVDGYSLPLNVADFRHILADIASASMGLGGTLTVRFQGSIGKEAPTFSSAASSTNRWSYVELIDTNTGETIQGDTGVTISGSDDLKKVELNVNGLDWICAQISGYNAPGNVTVFVGAMANG